MQLLDLLILASHLPHLIAAASLGSTIASHNSLSILHDVLHYHDLIDDLNEARNVTYFAPNNAALKYLADFGINLTTADPDIAKALIYYSLVDGAHSSKSIINNDHIQLVHSSLYPPLFTNVSDGQALKLTKNTTGSQPKVVLETGLQILTEVEESDIEFDHGFIHATGTNMVLPHNVSETCRLGQLKEFLRLVRSSGTELEINTLADMTVFIPHDAAVSRMNPLLEALNPTELAAVVRNHAVAGQVIYQDEVVDPVLEVETISGKVLQMRRGSEGQMFVNNVNIVRSDVLLYGGVAHIIDGILLPGLSKSLVLLCSFVTNGV